MLHSVIRTGICLAALAHVAAAQVSLPDRFGDEVAADERQIVVGSPNAQRQRGKIDVFVRRGRSWNHAGEIAAPSPQSKIFGARFRLDGNHLVVGDPRSTSGTGAAIVFSLTAQGQLGRGRPITLAASDGEPFHQFGLSLAISGELLVVGAPRALSPNSAAGAAYVFEKKRSGWQQVQKFTPSYNADDATGFGQGLAIDAKLLAVGAPMADTPQGPRAGLVMLYQRTDKGGMKSADPPQLGIARKGIEMFGQQIAMSPAHLVIGATLEDVEGRSEQGAVYVYSRDANGQVGQSAPSRLVPPDGGADDAFGSALALGGSVLCVGTNQHDVNGISNAGAVYVYRVGEDGSVPETPAQILTAPAPSEQELFGSAVTLSGETIVIGASASNRGKGAVYLFDPGDEGYSPTCRISPADGIIPLR